MARDAQSMVLDRLRSFVGHPDERVPIALVNNPLVHNLTVSKAGTKEWILRDALYQRAMEDARTQNFVWTPLLDTLAGQAYWPRAQYEETHEIFPESGRHRHSLIHATTQAEKLIPWISAQESPAALRPLLQFKFHRIGQLIAEYAKCLDARLVGEMLRWRSNVGEVFAKNESLRPELVALLTGWAMSVLSEEPTSRRVEPHLINSAASTLIELHKNGRLLAADIREQLTSIAIRHKARNLLHVSPYWVGEQGEAAIKVLFSLGESLETDLLRKLYEAYKDTPRLVQKIIDHPAATMELTRHIAANTGAVGVREALIRNPKALADPEIRKTLSKSTALNVLVALCQTAEPAELRRLFRRVAKKGPRTALGLLRHGNIDSRNLRLSDIELLADMGSRLNTLLWLRGKPLADDKKGHEGMVAEQYARRELAILVQEEFRRASSLAITLIENHAETIRDLVSPKDLLPLLQSSDRKARLTATMFLGELQRSEPGHAPLIASSGAGGRTVGMHSAG